jgi:hypothetical protein
MHGSLRFVVAARHRTGVHRGVMAMLVIAIHGGARLLRCREMIAMNRALIAGAARPRQRHQCRIRNGRVQQEKGKQASECTSALGKRFLSWRAGSHRSIYIIRQFVACGWTRRKNKRCNKDRTET